MNGFKSFSFLMVFIVATFLSTGIQSCSSEDDTDDVNISDNNTSSDFGVNDTINKAVTGGISKVGMTYANVFGYTNKFDMMTLIDIKENGFIGVEYGDSEDALTNRARCNTIEGRTLNIKISNLLPNKKYYYRTVIELNGVREVGEKVGHFNTNLLSYNGTISTGESETTYSDVIIEPGTVDESTLKDETHYIGIAVSLEKNKLTNGLSTRYKCAPFYDKWSTEATYDDVQFFRSFDSSSFTSTRIYNLDSGTTVYYTTILCIGDSVLTGNIREIVTKSVNDFTINSFYELKKGFDFIEVAGSNFIMKDYVNVSPEDLDYAYTYGVAYSTDKSKLSSGLLERYLESHDGVSFCTSYKYSSDRKTFVLDKLKCGSTIYYCSFLYMQGKMISSEIRNSTTRDITPKTGYVDLGLSRKWAACNVGASSPVEEGFMYDDNTAATSDIVLPSSNEVTELCNNCSLEEISTSEGNLKGILVTGRNGGQIYLPNNIYYINSRENRQEYNGNFKYLKHFHYKNRTFSIMESAYFSKYGSYSSYGYNAHRRAVQ